MSVGGRDGRATAVFVRVANSPKRLLAVFIGLMVGSSVAYSLFEEASFIDALYWSIVTATTLGYGDFSPKTTAGKGLAAALITLTVFVFIPMITANLASKLIVNRDVFTHEEQEAIKTSLGRIEATLASSTAGEERTSPSTP